MHTRTLNYWGRLLIEIALFDNNKCDRKQTRAGQSQESRAVDKHQDIFFVTLHTICSGFQQGTIDCREVLYTWRDQIGWIDYTVQIQSRSSLDPRRHLSCFQLARLLPLHSPGIASDTSSCECNISKGKNPSILLQTYHVSKQASTQAHASSTPCPKQV
jgi:hypothetical protein